MISASKIISSLPGVDIIRWLAPLGLSVRLACKTFTWQAFKSLSWQEIRFHCVWMGLKSFHLVALAAVFVGIALVLEGIIELQKYGAQDLSGALIAIGLLREIGPLTVGLAWCARVAAFISEEAQSYATTTEREFAQAFILPRYLAALMMSIPLGGYGLVIGFLTGAFIAPFCGLTTTNQFYKSACESVHYRDLFYYFIKLILVFPIIGVFAGSACGRVIRNSRASVAANAVTATFLVGFIANLVVTIVLLLLLN